MKAEKQRPLRFNPVLIGFALLILLGIAGTVLAWLEESARRESADRRAPGYRPSLVGRVNPFLPDATPTPPQLSKEYIYAGSRLLAVEDAGANAAPPADLAVWRPSSGVWWIIGANQTPVSYPWGIEGDVPVPGDYDGDGRTDFAIWRAGAWWITRSSDNSHYTFTLGAGGDRPAPADFDGDGRTDPAVYRADGANGVWEILRSSDSQLHQHQFGLVTDTPAPADYDGDGRADIGVWRDSDTKFYSRDSGNSQLRQILIGMTGDRPVPADYDGDGRADYALFRSADATWYIRRSTTGSVHQTPFGLGTDKLVQNDYDGDGRCDIAVWRGTESSPGAGDAGTWYIRQSATDTTRQQQWGLPGDIPVPAFYRR